MVKCPPVRVPKTPLQLKELSSLLFGNLPQGVGSTGNKVLKRKPSGPKLLSYYPTSVYQMWLSRREDGFDYADRMLAMGGLQSYNTIKSIRTSFEGGALYRFLQKNGHPDFTMLDDDLNRRRTKMYRKRLTGSAPIKGDKNRWMLNHYVRKELEEMVLPPSLIAQLESPDGPRIALQVFRIAQLRAQAVMDKKVTPDEMKLLRKHEYSAVIHRQPTPKLPIPIEYSDSELLSCETEVVENEHLFPQISRDRVPYSLVSATATALQRSQFGMVPLEKGILRQLAHYQATSNALEFLLSHGSPSLPDLDSLALSTFVDPSLYRSMVSADVNAPEPEFKRAMEELRRRTSAVMARAAWKRYRYYFVPDYTFPPARGEARPLIEELKRYIEATRLRLSALQQGSSATPLRGPPPIHELNTVHFWHALEISFADSVYPELISNPSGLAEKRAADARRGSYLLDHGSSFPPVENDFSYYNAGFGIQSQERKSSRLQNDRGHMVEYLESYRYIGNMMRDIVPTPRYLSMPVRMPSPSQQAPVVPLARREEKAPPPAPAPAAGGSTSPVASPEKGVFDDAIKPPVSQSDAADTRTEQLKTRLQEIRKKVYNEDRSYEILFQSKVESVQTARQIVEALKRTEPAAVTAFLENIFIDPEELASMPEETEESLLKRLSDSLKEHKEAMSSPGAPRVPRVSKEAMVIGNMFLEYMEGNGLLRKEDLGINPQNELPVREVASDVSLFRNLAKHSFEDFSIPPDESESDFFSYVPRRLLKQKLSHLLLEKELSNSALSDLHEKADLAWYQRINYGIYEPSASSPDAARAPSSAFSDLSRRMSTLSGPSMMPSPTPEQLALGSALGPSPLGLTYSHRLLLHKLGQLDRTQSLPTFVHDSSPDPANERALESGLDATLKEMNPYLLSSKNGSLLPVAPLKVRALYSETWRLIAKESLQSPPISRLATKDTSMKSVFSRLLAIRWASGGTFRDPSIGRDASMRSSLSWSEYLSEVAPSVVGRSATSRPGPSRADRDIDSLNAARSAASSKRGPMMVRLNYGGFIPVTIRTDEEDDIDADSDELYAARRMQRAARELESEIVESELSLDADIPPGSSGAVSAPKTKTGAGASGSGARRSNHSSEEGDQEAVPSEDSPPERHKGGFRPLTELQDTTPDPRPTVSAVNTMNAVRLSAKMMFNEKSVPEFLGQLQDQIHSQESPGSGKSSRAPPKKLDQHYAESLFGKGTPKSDYESHPLWQELVRRVNSPHLYRAPDEEPEPPTSSFLKTISSLWSRVQRQLNSDESEQAIAPDIGAKGTAAKKNTRGVTPRDVPRKSSDDALPPILEDVPSTFEDYLKHLPAPSNAKLAALGVQDWEEYRVQCLVKEKPEERGVRLPAPDAVDAIELHRTEFGDIVYFFLFDTYGVDLSALAPEELEYISQRMAKLRKKSVIESNYLSRSSPSQHSGHPTGHMVGLQQNYDTWLGPYKGFLLNNRKISLPESLTIPVYPIDEKILDLIGDRYVVQSKPGQAMTRNIYCDLRRSEASIRLQVADLRAVESVFLREMSQSSRRRALRRRLDPSVFDSPVSAAGASAVAGSASSSNALSVSSSVPEDFSMLSCSRMTQYFPRGSARASLSPQNDIDEEEEQEDAVAAAAPGGAGVSSSSSSLADEIKQMVSATQTSLRDRFAREVRDWDNLESYGLPRGLLEDRFWGLSSTELLGRFHGGATLSGSEVYREVVQSLKESLLHNMGLSVELTKFTSEEVSVRVPSLRSAMTSNVFALTLLSQGGGFRDHSLASGTAPGATAPSKVVWSWSSARR